MFTKARIRDDWQLVEFEGDAGCGGAHAVLPSRSLIYHCVLVRRMRHHQQRRNTTREESAFTGPSVELGIETRLLRGGVSRLLPLLYCRGWSVTCTFIGRGVCPWPPYRRLVLHSEFKPVNKSHYAPPRYRQPSFTTHPPSCRFRLLRFA